jgi:hypothetical protein
MLVHTPRLFHPIAGLMLVAGLLLVACGGSTTPATLTLQPTARPTSPPGAIEQAQQALGQQLDINPDTISIISSQPVEWPDACLGIHVRGQLCAQHVVPGYNVMLEAEGQRYEYHASEDGSVLAEVPGPIPPSGGAAITWQADEQCQTATIDEQGVMYGPCGGTLRDVPIVSDQQKQDLAQFSGAYAPFFAETPPGSVNLAGSGAMVAAAAEQRMIAEWARVTVKDAILGNVNATDDVAISKTSAATVAADISGAESITATSLTLIEALQDQLVYEVNLRVTLEPGQSSTWGPGSNLRWFELLREPEDWGIEKFASSPP